MQGSERWDALVVGYPRADRDWGRGSAWVGNRVVVGQWGHHDDIVFVLHGAGRAPLWARRQAVIWGQRVQVWVRAGAPVRRRWDNGDVIVVIIIAFVVDGGAVGVFHWHLGVSGKGGVLGLLSGPCPLLFPLCTLSAPSPLSSPPSVSSRKVGGGRLAAHRGCARWWDRKRVDGKKRAADRTIFGSITV